MLDGLITLQKGPNGYTIPSSLASTLFGVGTSLGGIIAGLIAGARYGNASSHKVPLRTLILPIGASAVVTTGAAILLPTS